MLTTEQYKFLKRVTKKDIPCGKLHQNRDKIYLYLLSKKFIETYNVYPNGDIMEKDPILYCHASEDGKVELKLCRQERYHFWIPTIISIIALATSILPIACSYVQTIFFQNVP